jgi:hypothetical protein
LVPPLQLYSSQLIVVACCVSATATDSVADRSQRNEAAAQAAYRVLQDKLPAVLGSRAVPIKRADLGDKDVFYRATVGPFATPDEAFQFCTNLKSASGQCVVQKD